ncbi:MAG: hypothetical protein JHC63_09185, partial [Acidimicrobiia bacterium]|nr:hypothetical protein [Acidimicrobiia bacterium]
MSSNSRRVEIIAAVLVGGAVATIAGSRWQRGLSSVRSDLRRRRGLPSAPGIVRLSVIVPAYNEEAQIPSTIS